MCSPWLITRPSPEAESDADALRARGVTAEPFPALIRRPLPWTQPALSDLLLLTSASVLEPVATAIAAWSAPPRIMALGPVTAARARALGLPVDLEVQGGVSALVDAVIAELGPERPARSALLPTSDQGAQSPEQRAALGRLERHLHVHVAPVIAVRPHPDLAARIGALPSPARWVFASPSAVEAVFSAGPPATARAVICHGASTEAAYRLAARGWPEPTLSQGATVVDRVLSTTQG